MARATNSFAGLSKRFNQVNDHATILESAASGEHFHWSD